MKKWKIILAGLFIYQPVMAQTSWNIHPGQGITASVSPENSNASKSPLTLRCGQPFTDPRDGQVYQTVPIINNCWMKQNLNYGTQIAWNVTPSSNGIVEKYCYDDLPGNCDIYGGLYRFGEAVQYSYGHAPQGACPPGWHVPTDGEYIQMHYYLNVAYYDFGGMVKEAGFAHWTGPNTGADNSTGFTAYGAGYYEVFGSWYYYHLNNYTYFWLSHDENPQCRTLEYSSDDFGYRSTVMPVGYSVRCVYDLPVNTQKIQNIVVPDTRCYQALDTIQTAGENTVFNMNSSASVNMISGSAIYMKQGTTIVNGTFLHAYISPGGPYCSPPGTLPVSTSEEENQYAGSLQNFRDKPFRVYPNPADQVLYLEPFDGRPFSAFIRMTDRLGNQVLSAETGPSLLFRLDITHLPSDIYCLSITGSGNTTVVKIVKGGKLFY